MSDLTIRKQTEVSASPERAWEVFTSGIAGWWPSQRFSLAPGDVTDVVLEPRAGGRVYEVRSDGSTADWAEVVAFEPPSRLLLVWRVDPAHATDLEVTFTPTATGTRVDLVHAGWERYADGADAASSYVGGWDRVLSLYAEAATADGVPASA